MVGSFSGNQILVHEFHPKKFISRAPGCGYQELPRFLEEIVHHCGGWVLELELESCHSFFFSLLVRAHLLRDQQMMSEVTLGP